MHIGMVSKFLYYRSWTLLSRSGSCQGRLINNLSIHQIIFSTRVHTKVPLYHITTPIFYVNDVPHIGHLYTAVLADILARWNRVKGHNVVYTTGTDEHGMKIQKAAIARGVSPLVHCDEISAQFQDLFKVANISHSYFIRTTDENHVKGVETFWRDLHERGHIYKGSYSGWYCTSDESFLTDDQVIDIKDKDDKIIKISRESHQPVEWIEEENYMFRLSAFKQRLLAWLTTDVIQPEKFRPLVVKWIEDHLQDLSVSRSRDRLSWGIPVPGDDSQTIYVWLDALVNYLTAAGYPDKGCHWPADCHVIGKDILKFHAIYWPAFLMAADMALPRVILCHSHWTVDGVKMSKSRGNVVDPFTSMEKFTVDGLRYFLVREAVPHSDANFSVDKVLNVINSELANTLGNLLNRSTSRSICPDHSFPEFDVALFTETASDDDIRMWNSLQKLPDIVDDQFTNCHINRGIEAIMNQLRMTNTYFDHHKPWELCKDQDHVVLLQNVLYISLETLRTCAILLQPVTPTLSKQILDQLNIPTESRTFQDAHKRHQGGEPLKELQLGPVFQRIKH